MTTSDVWQDTVDEPAFEWTASNDGTGSGSVGYYVYWGSNEFGTSAQYQEGITFDPQPVGSTSENYLRVMSTDSLQNNGTWITLYIFKYDVDSPTDPTSVSQSTSSTSSGVWQNSVPNPQFELLGVVDGGSGLAGFYFYWGADSNGETYDFQTGNTFNPSPLTETQIVYLRAMVQDNLGHNGTWDTYYTFMYDIEGPENPEDSLQILLR